MVIPQAIPKNDAHEVAIGLLITSRNPNKQDSGTVVTLQSMQVFIPVQQNIMINIMINTDGTNTLACPRAFTSSQPLFVRNASAASQCQ